MPDFYGLNENPTEDLMTKEFMGGKGYGLFQMAKLEVPVPGFCVIPTTLCVDYMAKPAETSKKVKKIAKEIIATFVQTYGYLPLLSVRSGARVSMPGMMDTILNVGVGDPKTNTYTDKLDVRARHDCIRRFLHMYGSTVLGIENSEFEAVMAEQRETAGVATDAELEPQYMQAAFEASEEVLIKHGHKPCYNVATQLESCILAVMNSWNSERAVAYRDETGIPHDWGTAVVVQRMVFGNMNDKSLTGVCFSRDPATGFDEVTGEFLPNAQGEDVVAGIRTPLPLTELPEDVLNRLCDISSLLEAHFLDMLDMEFTVEDGELFMLQVRTAQRSARAWVRSTLDMFNEELILERDTVFERIKREHVKLLTRPVIDPKFKTKPHLTGIPGCAGVVTGKAAFSAAQAIDFKEAGEDCILIAKETTPDDIKGMFASVGILTATGGTTSHAAVVARGMDKVCVTGCEQLEFGSDAAVYGPGKMISPGDKVTLDGTTGWAWVDIDVPVNDPTDDPLIAELSAFVDNGAQLADVALPDSPGTVYFCSQLLSDPPKPPVDHVIVIDDLSDKKDALLTLCGESDLGEAIGAKMVEWSDKHDVSIKFFSPQAKKVEVVGKITFMPVGEGLDALLDRPVTQDEIEALFKGSLGAIRKLLAPVRLEDKFQIIGCQRYRLLSAFQ